MNKEIIFYDKDTFGSHLTFSKNIKDTYQYAIDTKMHSFQFFMGSSKSYKRSIIADDDLNKSLKLFNDYPMNVFTHCSLLYNLAGSKKNNCLAWTGGKETDKVMDDIIKGIEYELSITSLFSPASQPKDKFSYVDEKKYKNGCVVHVGTWEDKKLGMDTIAKTINKISFPKNSTLLLENTTGRGSTIGQTFEELKYIYDLVDKKDNIKFCFDTAHGFAGGIYDLRKELEVDRLFNDFSSTFGLDKLGLIHFNDSHYDFGKKGDEHRCIGTGKIWKDNMKACKYIIEKIDKEKIPLVLETYPSDLEVIQCL